MKLIKTELMALSKNLIIYQSATQLTLRPTLKHYLRLACLPFIFALWSSQSIAAIWNSPYVTADKDTLYTSFSSPPKHLDPVVSYNSNEWTFLSQVYEPPLQYHYLKRPYTLEPLTLSSMPTIHYFDKSGQRIIDIENSNKNVAFSEYYFELKPNIQFYPHPAFAKEGNSYIYHDLASDSKGVDLDGIKSVYDFEKLEKRNLIAADYVYAIKRMALRQNHSPVYDSMKAYIVGLEAFSKEVTDAFKAQLKKQDSTSKSSYFPLNDYELSGVKALDETRFKIRIKGQYPQFLYWLTMNFFAPIPWEADKFYKQEVLVKKNITLDTTPVGTGPYYLAENNPNRVMRLKANPYYHDSFYPTDGLAEGADPALLADAGKKLPFVQEVVYTLEKESVPLWNKFLQGFYDASGVSSDSFDQAVSITSGGNMQLTEQMQEKGIRFLSQIQPTIFYFGFNMSDEVVGGYSEKQQKLRQAISIAVNFEEYISIFMNGRGETAQSPIPPGIYGHQDGKDGFNPVIYEWKNNRPQRKELAVAKKLLAEAGYPDGRDQNGEPLTLYYDTAATGPDSQSQLNWYRKQFAKLGINLVIRATDYNRFQDKVRGAKVQMFSWGWNADYPDPENFLFLLYGGNAAINTNGGGVNSANYDNPEFNRLFEEMKTMKNGPERMAIIEQMIDIARQDAPWIWGFHPKALALYHDWLKNVWPNALANNTTKYRRIDSAAREQSQLEWNKPVTWPLVLVFLILVISIWPLTKAYQNRQKTVIKPTEVSRSSNNNPSIKEGS